MTRASRLRALAVAGLVLAASSTAEAQAPGAGFGIDVDFDALGGAKVGAWADYTVDAPNHAESAVMRYALVDRGAKTLSLEMDATSPKGEVDVRFDFTAPGPDVWTATGGKMRIGDRVSDLPSADVAKSPPLTRGALPGALVGTEEVATPAGTFACRHYRREFPVKDDKPLTVDLWMSAKVLPTGLVRSRMTSDKGGSMTMSLVATGQGAKSKIR